MLRILVVTSRPQGLDSFVRTLASDPGVRLQAVASGAEALDVVRTSPPHLALIDADLPDTESMSLVQKLLMVNAMVNTAVVSPLSEDAFHEASEGLGVLAGVPIEPGKEDAEMVLSRLRSVMGLSR